MVPAIVRLVIVMPTIIGRIIIEPIVIVIAPIVIVIMPIVIESVPITIVIAPTAIVVVPIVIRPNTVEWIIIWSTIIKEVIINQLIAKQIVALPTTKMKTINLLASSSESIEQLTIKPEFAYFCGAFVP